MSVSSKGANGTNGMPYAIANENYFNSHTNEPYIPSVAIVGAGKIGTALARSLMTAGTAGEVMMWNRSSHEEAPAVQGGLRALDQSNNIHADYINAVKDSKGINHKKRPLIFR